MKPATIKRRAVTLFKELGSVESQKALIEILNFIRLELHQYSPFKGEPVDCVLWVPQEKVIANDYNPNSVAPPEMKLLERSIEQDGYTQPIVAWGVDGRFEVVDGFHRNRVGRECANIKERVKGHLPLSIINAEREGRGDRISSTIRHNRARGKHQVEAMSDIVIELKRRNWSDERVSRELGMEQDEVLRLCQITGLADLFSNQEFSQSWDIEGEIDESDFDELTEDIDSELEQLKFQNVHTGGTEIAPRVFHRFENWECYKAGFYDTTKSGMTTEQCQMAYKDFLSNPKKFSSVLGIVTKEWKNSCEHYLTNSSMNRIAWLGQAAACRHLGIPSTFRGGFSLLSMREQRAANKVALKHLNKWLKRNGKDAVGMEEATSSRQSDIY